LRDPRWPIPGFACPAEPSTSNTWRRAIYLSGQPHFELLASMKLLTELATLAASLVTVAIAAAEEFDDSAAAEPLSASTDEVIALVWLGKSPLAELTTAVASLWILSTCDFRPLTPLLVFRLVSPLTEFWRLARSVQ